MINTDRIVQVSKTDLLTLYGTILKIASVSVAAAQATAPGEFKITSAATALIAAEPVESLDFAAAVTSATVYFVAAYNYAGFKIAGTAVETAGADVVADAATLYTATLSGGVVTIAKVGF